MFTSFLNNLSLDLHTLQKAEILILVTMDFQTLRKNLLWQGSPVNKELKRSTHTHTPLHCTTREADNEYTEKFQREKKKIPYMEFFNLNLSECLHI